MMNIKMLSKVSVRSVVVIILVVGGLGLAIIDHNFRPTFGDLAKIGVGGYLGQMLPEATKRSGDSMHMSFLNEGKRGESPELDSFLNEQLENQKLWRKELNITKDEAADAYAFFEWCDRLSLILCKHELPDGERALEISSHLNNTRYDVMQRSDGSVIVEPWAFQEQEFTVRVEASYLDQIQFSSNDELTEALKTAPIKTLEWKFVK